MRLYALVEAGDPEAIELFVTEKDARRALEDCLRDEPEWRDCHGLSRSTLVSPTRLRTKAYRARRSDQNPQGVRLSLFGSQSSSASLTRRCTRCQPTSL